MNRKRKVLITITYNEMGIIIDTKAEEVAQPNLQPTCNQLATDTISRQTAIETAIEAADKWDGGYISEREGIIRKFFDKVPAAQPDHNADVSKKVSISKVIRCKDCKFARITNDGRYCKYCDMFTDDYGQLIEMYFDSNFYCGYAERRTDGQSKSD